MTHCHISLRGCITDEIIYAFDENIILICSLQVDFDDFFRYSDGIFKLIDVFIIFEHFFTTYQNKWAKKAKFILLKNITLIERQITSLTVRPMFPKLCGL